MHGKLWWDLCTKGGHLGDTGPAARWPVTGKLEDHD